MVNHPFLHLSSLFFHIRTILSCI